MTSRAWQRLVAQVGRLVLLRRLATPLAIFLLVAAIGRLGWFTPIEHALMDLRFRLTERPASGSLIVVEIDNRSLQALDVWPWPRSYHAALLDRLAAAGTDAVALDIDFSSHSAVAGDAALAAALARSGGNVILPVFKQYGSPARAAADLRFTAPRAPFRGAARLASVNLQPASSGQVRLYARAEPWEGRDIPSMAAALAGIYGGAARDFYLDFGIRLDTVPHVSYVDLLRGDVDPALFAGKRVLVGATAVELGDQTAVPLHRVMSGVMVQALAYESLVQHRTLLRSAPSITFGIALLLALVVGPRFARWSWRRGAAVLVGAGLGAFGLATLLQMLLPLSLDIVAWLLVLAISYLVSLTSGVDHLARRLLRKGMTLLHRSAMMRALLEDSFDGIIVAREDGTIEIINPAARRLLGAAEDAPLGGHVARFIDLPAAPIDRQGGIGIAGEQRRPRSTELHRLDDTKLPVELVVWTVALRPVRHRLERRQEERRLTIFTFRDVSERQRAEAAQQAALERALAADRAKTEFIHNMSHELRTPLNAIIGFSEMIREQMLGPLGNDTYVTYAADIHRSGTGLLETINSILDMARIEGGRYELSESPLDLVEVVERAVAAVAPGAAQRKIEIRRPTARSLPLVRADERAVTQALAGLLVNAVKFTREDGSIQVAAELDAAGDYRISIADNGIGMSAEQIARAMKPFQQADTSLARKYDGAGLGLSLAAGFMALHGGRLAVASEAGAGTTVTLCFPAARLIAREAMAEVG